MTSSIGSSNEPACRACARASSQAPLAAAREGLRWSTRPSTDSRSRLVLSEFEVIVGRCGSMTGGGAAAAGFSENSGPNKMNAASLTKGRSYCMEQSPPETRIPPRHGGARKRALDNGPERAPEELLESECGRLWRGRARCSALEVYEADGPRHGFGSAWSDGGHRHGRNETIVCAAVVNAYGAQIGRASCRERGGMSERAGALQRREWA